MREVDCSQESIDGQGGYYYFLGNAWPQQLQMTGCPEITLGNNEAIEQEMRLSRSALFNLAKVIGGS